MNLKSAFEQLPLTRRELLRRSGMGFAMLGLAGVLGDPVDIVTGKIDLRDPA